MKVSRYAVLGLSLALAVGIGQASAFAPVFGLHIQGPDFAYGGFGASVA